MSYLDNFKGATVAAPIKKTITYTIPETGEEVTGEVYVRQYSMSDARRMVSAYSASEKDKDLLLAQSISENILVEKSAEDKTLVSIGEPEEIKKLSQPFTFALLKAIGEVNSPKKQNSQKKKNSSAN